MQTKAQAEDEDWESWRSYLTTAPVLRMALVSLEPVNAFFHGQDCAQEGSVLNLDGLMTISSAIYHLKCIYRPW